MIVLVTGDRGLAGAFNTNIIREGLRLKREFDARRRRGRLLGRRTPRQLDDESSAARSSAPPTSASPTVPRSPTRARSRATDRGLRRRGARPGRAGLQPLRLAADPVRLRRQTLLPLQQAEVVGEGVDAEEEEAEETETRAGAQPLAAGLRARARGAARPAIPEYVNISVYRALLESSASELGARMTAMRSAAENAENMMDDLTLEMNRVRQAEITQEILEVVAGAEALG